MRKGLALLLALALLLTSCAALAEEDTIKIGGIAPLTGTVANYGLLVQNGVNTYIDEINENGGIVLPDIREGETIITEMWFLIEELKAKRDGRVFDRETASVPPIFDYRQCETKYRRPARRRGTSAEKSADNK